MSIAVCTIAFLCPTVAFTAERNQSYHFEVETTIEIKDKDKEARPVVSRIKVWFKEGSVRLEKEGFPIDRPRIASIERDGQAYVLNLTDKTVIKQPMVTDSSTGLLATAKQEYQEITNYVDALTRQQAVKVASEDVAGQLTDVYEVPHAKEAMNEQASSHKVWVSHTLNVLVKEVMESPEAKRTIVYKTGKIGEVIPDDLFAIPEDFKSVE